VLRGNLVYSSNKPACGGARDGGKRQGSAEVTFCSRWLRIFSMTTGSSMQAMTCRDALMPRAQDAQERRSRAPRRRPDRFHRAPPCARPLRGSLRCANRLSCRFVDVDAKYALESLRPTHRCSTFGGCLLGRIPPREALRSLAPLGRRHPRAVPAVRSEEPIISRLSCSS
jgi:hypothetical protein